ncbi:MAG: T9SS type A sorting domain-containing protein [Bacteroidales bacterium]|nr:T9SS type A sorting domain-containing protein [Bacteroidales bacterium]MCF8345441.1 T9SS type A sorting domain-containing protein [Bacteroidales bacterium]MCF8351013.1 T9SS type A sorting domain-containing protein [Bacteroidales bacterium]MCF8377867.1 T9SS type A sorting domain-containing protein [Bacteroidales bacterium]
MGNYRLWDGDLDGDTIIDMGAYEFGAPFLPVGVEEKPPESGLVAILVYPNPVSRSSVISYHLPESGHVMIDIYDMSGRKVATLVDGHRAKDHHMFTWDVSGMPNGLYFCRLTSRNQASTVKMIINH